MSDDGDAFPLLGHDDAISRLARAWRSARMHHALLLSGPQGIGKATLARRLAAAIASGEREIAPVLRTGEGASAAHGLSGVRTLRLGQTPDGRTKKFIGVDDVRGVAPFLRQRLPGGAWRVVVVDSVDDLNASAANALLKVLEEPGERTQYLLVSHGTRPVLPTIRSRCLEVRLAPLGPDDLAGVLSRLSVGPLPAEQLARAGGSVGRGLLLAEHVEVIEMIDRVLAASRWPSAAVGRLLDATTGRGGEGAFALARETLSLHLSEGAKRAAGERPNVASRLAGAAIGIAERMAEREAYGVDARTNLRNAVTEARRALSLDVAT